MGVLELGLVTTCAQGRLSLVGAYEKKLGQILINAFVEDRWTESLLAYDVGF